MELFLEFSLTLFFSFLFSFIVSKLLSVSSSTFTGSGDDYPGGAFNCVKLKRNRIRTRNVRSSKPEKTVGFAAEFVQVEEFSRFSYRDNGRGLASPTNKEPRAEEFSERGSLDCDEIEMLDLGGAVALECEIVEVSECGDDLVEVGWVKNAGMVFDEWQGVERSELERLFGAAVAYVGSTLAAANYSHPRNELKLQLYGLHKIAIDGPCHAPRPMALKVSARAKWNSWQQLGDINRDEAMEQYINLLSSHIPEWRKTLLPVKS
ncbi:unnamed protein product [Linum tenue]|uniref:ACB domain-containing protein n=1 Tax=Linum tenue TaxID=586396 RepID=A0AAV0L8J9_9ROSI|nr:unnamed protein product [Linum tenue]